MEIKELRALQGDLAEIGLPDLYVKPIQFFLSEFFISPPDYNGRCSQAEKNLLEEFFFESMESEKEILKTINQRKIRIKLQGFFNEEGKRKCMGKAGFSSMNHLLNLVQLPGKPERERYIIFGFRTQQKLLVAKIWEHCVRPSSPAWTLMQIGDQTVSKIHKLVEDSPFFSHTSENI